MIDLHLGDCLDVMQTLPDGCVDAVVTDPPYGLKFLGRKWDHGVPGIPFWSAMLRVLKPGGYLLAFGGTRTFHRQVCAIEDAGFQIRDCLMWLYGQGFPKAKSCLKPGWEPITLAWKPSKNVPPLNIEECRLATDPDDAVAMARCNTPGSGRLHPRERMYSGAAKGSGPLDTSVGRWPANLVLSHHPDCNGECVEGCPVAELDRQSGTLKSGLLKAGTKRTQDGGYHGNFPEIAALTDFGGDCGGASRFFYCAKASQDDRGEGNTHVAVKPTELMRWLCRLITPAGGTILDPYMGSGSTIKAAMMEGFGAIGIESDEGYFKIAEARIADAIARTPLFGTP